jgi:hypothetical protein
MAYNAQPSKSQYGHPQIHTNAAGNSEYNGGETYAVKIPIDYTIADTTVLFTMPVRSRLVAAFWEVTTGFTGGSSSTIGLSSSRSPHDAKGDVHGGSAGDATAVLGTAGVVRGTQGLSVTATPFVVVLEKDDTIKFDRVTSAYTAGAGYVHLEFIVAG